MMDYTGSMLRPSQADPRDHRYLRATNGIRSEVDLREYASDIEDQSTLGSCVGSAITNVYELMLRQQAPEKFVELSRLFVYYNARVLEDAISLDQGATLRNGLKGCQIYGICREEIWPFEIEKFDDRPTDECYADALSRRIGEYRRLDTLEDVLDALNGNHPVVAGMTLYQDFMYLTSQDPVIPMPRDDEEPIGDHALALVGYDLGGQRLLAKNSFGSHWGMSGYCWIPFDYARKYMFEQWVFDITLS